MKFPRQGFFREGGNTAAIDCDLFKKRLSKVGILFVMALLGFGACSQAMPEGVSTPMVACVEVRYLSRQAGLSAIEGVYCFALENPTANANAPSWHGAFFTGKPHVDGLGYAFLLRNYRPDHGKWLTADPLGYPDGWNNLAYCGNLPCSVIDYLGAWTVQIGVTFTGGGAVGGTFSGGIVFGYSSESGFTAGFYENIGGGSCIGASAGISATMGISGANGVNALRGTAMAVGGSMGEGITWGADGNFPTDMASLGNSLYDVSIGIGIGTPVEIHTFIAETFTQQVIQWGGTIEYE